MGKLSVAALKNLCLNGVISCTEYWKLRKLQKKINLRPSYRRQQFCLSKYNAQECLIWFRFTPSELHQLLTTLNIPEECYLKNRIKFTGMEGLCILLRRLSYPNRLNDLVQFFNRDPGSISNIFNWMLNYIYTHHISKISQMEQLYITKEKLSEFSEVCSLAGCPYPNIVGFIDGTSRSICRPTYNQKQLYSGYKKRHVVKYQSIVFPNGLIGRLDGPFIGRRHDAAILHLSNALNEMQRIFNNDDGTWYSLYGDPGYANQKHIKVGFKNYKQLTPTQKEFNAVMSSLRVGVEYGFGQVIQQFSFLDYSKNQKLYLQQVKKMYFVAAILTNCQTCLRGRNQITDIFKTKPPTIAEYFY